MSEENYYSLLEVTQNASTDEMKQKYKKLARKFHPDNRETGNEETFKKLGEAYATLADQQKRAVYDRVGHQAYTQGGGASPYSAGFGNEEIFDDLQDIFEGFFGGGSFAGGRGRRGGKQGKGRERGPDMQVVMDLDFMEAVFGVQKTIQIPRLINCTVCNGSGADLSVGTKTCPTCNGSGEIRKSSQSFLGVITQVSTCPTCHGSGQIIPVPCKPCNGKGQIKENQDLEIKIPKGVEDGSRLVWSQKGNEGKNGGAAGDLYLLLKVKPHEKLKREGLHILEEIDINVWQAIVGGQINAETVHGIEPIEIKPGTQSNSTISLNSKGIKLDTGKTGNHYVRINVKIPTKADLPSNLLELINSELMDKENKKSALEGFASFFKKKE